MPAVALDHLSIEQKTELAELLAEQARRQAYGSLISYCQHTYPGYLAPPHIKETAEALEAVEDGHLDRLIVTVPVRHGKSLLCSQRFPLWYMGKNPGSEIIHAAYGGQLVSDFGANMRNLTMNPAHRDVFPECILSQDQKAANRWTTRQGGIYVAAGVGGGITGRGMDLGVVDDPLRGREDAESQRIRDKVWQWYQNDFYTRLLPGGRIVIVGSRWHEDDLIGRLLENNDGWHVIHHKALSDEGEALWPARYGLDALARIREQVGNRAWQALYQGEPSPDTGTFFDRASIHLDEAPPTSEMRVYGASDYAVTDGGGDYTVHMIVGIDRWDRPWVLDVFREQTTPDRWALAMIVLMRQWEPIVWAEEKSHITSSVGPLVDRMQREAECWVRRRSFSSAADKPTKSRAIQGYIALNGLHIPHKAPFAANLIHEMMQFPNGKHDDMVDCLGLVGRLLRQTTAGEPEITVAKHDPTWDLFDLTRHEEEERL